MKGSKSSHQLTQVASPPEPALLLRDREVAQQLGVSASMVRKLAYRGGLPCVRIGTSLRFRRKDVLDYIDNLGR